MQQPAEYSQLVDYIAGRSTKLDIKDKNVVILGLLALTPVFSELVQLSTSVSETYNISDLWTRARVEHYPNQRRLSLVPKLQKQIISLGTKYQDLVFRISNLVATPVATVEGFISLTSEPNFVGFYSSLITAYCYRKGIGVPVNNDEALKYIKRAVEITEKTTDELDLSILLNILKKWFDSSHFEIADLTCRVVTLQVSKSSRFDINSLSAFFSSKLARMKSARDSVKEATPDQVAKLDGYYSDVYKTYFEMKLRLLTAEIKTKKNTDFDCYITIKDLTEDEHLKNPPLNPGELFDELLNYADRFSAQNYNIQAAKLYTSHFQLSRSPVSALRLANLAANGQIRTQYTDPVVSDFEATAVHYDNAINEAINECDMAALAVALREYKKIENKILSLGDSKISKKLKAEVHSYIPEKVKAAIVALKTIDDKKDKRLSFRIEQMKKRNNIRNLECYMIEELIKIVVEHSLDLSLLQALSDFHFERHPDSHDIWFKMMANSIAPEANQTQSTQNGILLKTYEQVLPRITVRIELAKELNVAAVSELLDCIKKHRLDLNSSSLSDQFFVAVNGFIDRVLISSVVNRDIKKLKTLKTIFDNNPLAQIVNRSAELTHWIDRTTFEIEFRAECKGPFAGVGPLPEIFRLAAGEKRGEKPMFSAFRSVTYLDQLKEKHHPEAYLKVAQLLKVRLSPQQADANFIELGVYIIKAMTYKDFMPGDSLGIYPTLAFEVIDELKAMAKEEEGYTGRQRSLIHFYHALALLIKDPIRFHQDKTSLFDGKDCQLVASSALELIENTKLIFEIEVKRVLLERIVGLDKGIDELTLDKAKKALAKLPAAPTPAALPSAVPLEERPLAYNPHALAANAATPAAAMVPIPVNVQMDQPSDAIDTHSVLQPALTPELHLAAIQGELALLRQQYQQALELLKQNEVLSAQKDAALQQAQSESQQKEAELTACKSELKACKSQLSKSEEQRKAQEVRLTAFFKISKDLVAALEPSAAPAASESASNAL